MFMRRGFIALLLLFLGLQTEARVVEYEEARRRAEQFFAEQDRLGALKSGGLVKADTFCTWPAGGSGLLKKAATGRAPAFYIFNRLDREGFVVLSAVEGVREVLAWSSGSRVCAIPPPMKALLDQYAGEIALAHQYGITSSGLTGDGLAAEPLLGEIRWNQSPDPFNTLCPKDTPTGRICPAGCVATALAQLLYYWKYPRVGTGSFGYTTSYGYLTADFGAAEYNYEAMSDQPWPGVPNPEIAKLVYHCAVAVEMEFGPYSSNTYTGLITGALEKYFKYKKPTLVNRSVYSPEAWRTLIVNEINAKRPVIYSAMDPFEPAIPGDIAGGHAFVVDGYDAGGLFHINWGWSGCSDGYYSLDLLNPSDCAEQYTYSSSHSVIVGIEPLTSFECLLSAGKGQLMFPVGGGQDSIALKSNADWTVTTPDWWLHATPVSGKGDGQVVVEARSNANFLGRTGKVTIKGCGLTHEITVVQDGTCLLGPAVEELLFPVAANSSSFTLRSTASWMITTASPWIRVSPDMGNGEESITVSVESNEGGTAREGSLQISGCSVTKEIAIRQEGSCTLVPGAHSVDLSPAAGSSSVEILSNGEWSAESTDGWMTVTPSSGKGNGLLTIQVTSNDGATRRTGTVTLRGCNTLRTIQVTQQGSCSLEVLPLELEMAAPASERYVTVSSGTSWKATTAEPWITLSPASATGTAMLRISTAENTASAPRSGVVLITGCNAVVTITVTQRSSCLFDLSSYLLDFTYMPGSKSLSVSTVSRWTAKSDSSWITLSPASGTKGATVKIDVAQNTGKTPRTGTIVFSGCNYNRVVRVEQKACTFTLAEEQLRFSPEGGTRALNISSNTSWSLLTGDPWIRLSAFSGQKDGSVTVVAGGNSAGIRTGTIRVSGCFSSEQVEVIQEGVATPAGEVNLARARVWPSPATGFVNLEYPEPHHQALLEIYSSTGLKIMSIKDPGLRISLAGIPPGLYLFCLRNGDFQAQEKIVIR